MKTHLSLEARLTVAETVIAELQEQVISSQSTNWLQQITGSFKNESAFDEILVYGQAIRQGDESLLEIQNEQ